MATPSPDPRSFDLAADAVARAAEHRRAVHRADPRYAHYPAGAFDEQVDGVPAHPRDAGGGWWEVGTVLDGPTDQDLRVWVHPERRLVRVERQEPRPTPDPPASERPVSETLDRCLVARPGWVHTIADQPYCGRCASAALDRLTPREAVRSTPVGETLPATCRACGGAIR